MSRRPPAPGRTAWLVTESAPLQEQAEYLSVLADPDSRTAKRLKELAPGVQIVDALTAGDVRTVSRVRLDVMKLLSGAGVRGR